MTPKLKKRMESIYKGNELDIMQDWNAAYDNDFKRYVAGGGDSSSSILARAGGGKSSNILARGDDSSSSDEDDDSDSSSSSDEDDETSFNEDELLDEFSGDYHETKQNIQEVKNDIIFGRDYDGFVKVDNRERRYSKIHPSAAALKKATYEYVAALVAFDEAKKIEEEVRTKFARREISNVNEIDKANHAVFEAEEKVTEKRAEIPPLRVRFKRAIAANIKMENFQTMENKTRASILSEDKVEGKAQARTFLLSVFYDKLRGKIPGKIEVFQQMGFNDLAQNFFLWSNPLLEHQQKKKKGIGQDSSENKKDLSNPLTRRNTRKRCKSCNKNYARKLGLCCTCLKGETNVGKYFCVDCNARVVHKMGNRCGICAKTNKMCVICEQRERRLAGGLCRPCSRSTKSGSKSA